MTNETNNNNMKYIKNGIIATAGHGWAEIEKQVPIYEEATEEEMMQEGYKPKIVGYETITQRVLNATEQMLIDSGYLPYVEPTDPAIEARQRMSEIQQELSDTDYIVLKQVEEYDVSEYKDILKKRKELREEYNDLEIQEYN